MAKPNHKEIESEKFSSGQRFCLDRVSRDDEDGRTEYAFVWRGTKATTEGFVRRPAYFGWEMLGKVIRRAIIKGKIPEEEVRNFQRGLLDL